MHASNLPLPPQVLLYQLWKSATYYLPSMKKISSVKQWIIMLGEYIQLDEKKLIKKSKRKWAAQIQNIHVLSWEPHYCINKEGFLSSLSSDNLICKWWKKPQERSCYQFQSDKGRLAASVEYPKEFRTIKMRWRQRWQWRPSSQDCLTFNFILQALCALLVKINLLYAKEITLFWSSHFIAATLLVWSLKGNSYWT